MQKREGMQDISPSYMDFKSHPLPSSPAHASTKLVSTYLDNTEPPIHEQNPSESNLTQGSDSSLV